MNNAAFSGLRERLAESAFVTEIDVLGGKVFRDVNKDTMLLFFSRSIDRSFKCDVTFYDASPTKFGELKSATTVEHSKLVSSSSIRVSSAATEEALSKIYAAPAGRLAQYCNTFQGIVTGADDVFILPTEESSQLAANDRVFLRPFLFGADIKRFDEVHAPQAIAYVRRNDTPDLNGQLIARLSAARERLEKRRETLQGKIPWYALHWSRDPRIFEQPKLLIQGIRNLTLPRRVVATLDNSNAYAGVNLTIVNVAEGADAKLLGVLGILNSAAVNFLFRHRLVDHRIKNSYIDQVPFPVSPASNDKNWLRLVSLVDSMLSLHARLASEPLPQRREQIQREIEATDRQIDELVYQMYGLTQDEIRIVEEATA